MPRLLEPNREVSSVGHYRLNGRGGKQTKAAAAVVVLCTLFAPFGIASAQDVATRQDVRYALHTCGRSWNWVKADRDCPTLIPRDRLPLRRTIKRRCNECQSITLGHIGNREFSSAIRAHTERLVLQSIESDWAIRS